MLQFNINYLAVVVSAAAAFALGMAWYSPFLFGKQWMKGMGLDNKKMEEMKKGKAMKMTFAKSFVAGLVMAFVLAQLVRLTGTTTGPEGGVLGLLVAILAGAVAFSQVLYEGKSLSVFWMSVGYHTVSLMVMGIILTVWR